MRDRRGNRRAVVIGIGAAAALLLWTGRADAHCDTMDGPVVKAAQKALETGDADLVLLWVQPQDEGEVREAFTKALAVRKLGPDALALADRFFFETLVRVHRAGEGAPYAGLKPAGAGMGPAVRAADEALAQGSATHVLKMLTDAVHDGLHQRFQRLLAAKGYRKDDARAGRDFVKAYVDFVHYVEGLHAAAAAGAHAAEPAPAAAHGEHHH